MNTEINPKISHLNQYFTTTEFNFINKISLGNQDIDYNINKQIKIRDIIVTFINRLNTSNSNLTLVKNVQSIFERVNENLKLMYLEKEDLENLSNNIIDLLIQIESSNSSISSEYMNSIKNIKEQINDISQKNIDYEKIIFENNNVIYSFIYSTNISKYFSLFGITIPEEITNQDQKSDNKDTSDSNYPSDKFSNQIENPAQDTQIENLSSNNETETYSQTNGYSENKEKPNRPTSNNLLLVSEKKGKVYLPYTNAELKLYLEQYPDSYLSYEDVIKKEFILPLDYYNKHPVLARFRESYSLIKDREAKSILDALKYAFDMMFRYELNPIIIAACKTQDQLEHYLDCIKKNKLEEFKDFDIKFEVSMRKK